MKYKGRRINSDFIFYWLIYTTFLTAAFSTINWIFVLVVPLITLIGVYWQLEQEIRKNES